MSGRDERRISKIPRCPACGVLNDMIIKYDDNTIAGWIISERLMQKLGGITVLTNTNFNLTRDPVVAECGGCNMFDQDVATAALRYFKDKVQRKEYITWDGYVELI